VRLRYNRQQQAACFLAHLLLIKQETCLLEKCHYVVFPSKKKNVCTSCKLHKDFAGKLRRSLLVLVLGSRQSVFFGINPLLGLDVMKEAPSTSHRLGRCCLRRAWLRGCRRRVCGGRRLRLLFLCRRGRCRLAGGSVTGGCVVGKLHGFNKCVRIRMPRLMVVARMLRRDILCV
jgi:hypothetical protein